MEIILGTATRQASFVIEDPSDIAAARRAANELARHNGLDETHCGRAALLVMEAGTNIIKHATRGEILLRPVMCQDNAGLEIIALDHGPGMSNLARSMQDGTSTAGSYGVGLGAIQRVADELDVYTRPDLGTVIWMTVWSHKPAGAAFPWDIGVVCLPLAGETECGDAWAVAGDENRLQLVVADGLGHGPIAAVAAEAATAVLPQSRDLPPAMLMQDMHTALRNTRGAAVAIAQIECSTEQVSFAGVGNIAACVVDGTQRRQLMSHNGIVGSNLRKVQEIALPWTIDATIVLHSDGLGTRWTLEQYAGLAECHPAVIAAVLYRDFSRRRDDVTVLVVRETAQVCQ